jgi:hypothetical protein
MTVGELLGFGIPALAGAALFSLGLEDSLLGVALAVVAGAGEGAVLAWALRQVLPGLSRRAWVAATAGGAALAWLLVLAPMRLLTQPPALTPLFWLAAGVVGLLFLLSIGGAQWLVLRSHVPRAGWWIVANAIAWPAGVAVPMLALTAIPDATPLGWRAVVAVVSGLGMGLVVGALTGLVLVWLLSGKPEAVPGARPLAPAR